MEKTIPNLGVAARPQLELHRGSSSVVVLFFLFLRKRLKQKHPSQLSAFFSIYLNVIIGVPQVWLLGPTCFNMYFHFVGQNITDAFLHLYTDD